MSLMLGRLRKALLLGFVVGLSGCGGGHGNAGLPASVPAVVDPMRTPASVSPGRIPAPPMARTAPQPASAMMSKRHPSSEIEPLGYTQLPGAATSVAASPDGSIWALSTQGTGADKYIYHYAGGSWTNIPGAAVRLTVAPDNTLWAVNSSGGIYAYSGSGWSALAGGASDVSIGSDGSVYAVSNQGGNAYGRGIWHYAAGTWTQLPGAAMRVAASWDGGTYPGIFPGGFYAINGAGSIYYYNPSTGFQALPGSAAEVAPTRIGGLFALGYPARSSGNPVYYDDLNSGTWGQQNGAGISIATDSFRVYVIGAANGIYWAPLKQVATGTPLTGPNYGPPPTGGWGPTALANALNFPVQSRFDGNGFTIAIVIDSNISASDLNQYLTYFQIPRTARSIGYELIDGASAVPKGDNSTFEATLDSQTVAGLAPGANIRIYVIPQLSSSYEIDAYQQIINDRSASIVSMSFGGCESPGSYWQNGESTVFQTGANDGIAFIASSGDQGNECYVGTGTYRPGAVYPASDPNVIGVGGTETWRPGGDSLTNTTAWNDNHFSNGQGATGGGVSSSFAIPFYQQGLGVASMQYRNVPDVAMPAEYDAIFSNGAWTAASGTSWSAPAFAAMLAEVYQYCGASFYGPTEIPYYVYSRAGYSAFLDVVSGNNQFAYSTPAYAAGPGYDNTTGIGVPLGMPFANTLCPNRVPAARLRAPRGIRAATRGPDGPVALDLTPKRRDLTDRGRRPAAEPTRIQLVLRPVASLAADERTVIGVLQAAGFTITRTFANHLVVDAQAPSGAVERLFSTQIHDVWQGRHGVRYTPLGSGVLPASLAPYVAGFSLDDLVTMSSRH